MAVTGSYGPIVPADLELIREGTLTGIEAATQSYTAGALLLDSSGSLAQVAADPTAVRGIAVKAATGTTGKVVEYWPIKAGRLYEMTFEGTIAQSDIHSNVGVTKDATTGYWYANPSETEDILTIQSLAKGYAIGDTKPRILVTFDTGNTQGA
jgi:hypothetical protein